MLPYQTALLVLATITSFTAAVPAPRLSVSVHNATSGETTTQQLDSSLIDPKLASLLNNNEVNINILSDKKVKRSRPSFIDSRALSERRVRLDTSNTNATTVSSPTNGSNSSDPVTPPPIQPSPAPLNNGTGVDNSTATPFPSPPPSSSSSSSGITLNIDASTPGTNSTGGIHNSTISITFDARPSVNDPPATAAAAAVEPSVVNEKRTPAVAVVVVPKKITRRRFMMRRAASPKAVAAREVAARANGGKRNTRRTTSSSSSQPSWSREVGKMRFALLRTRAPAPAAPLLQELAALPF